MKFAKFKLTLLLIVVLLLSAILLFGCKDKPTEPTTQRLTVADLDLPEHLDTEKLFGLFFMNGDGSYTSSTAELSQINYDPEKPLVIFIHGMQYAYGYRDHDDMPNVDGILGAGYNYGVFIWSQVADLGPMPAGAAKYIWGRNNGYFKYADENGESVRAETPVKYSMAECFCAYYLDFMERAGFKGNQILFTGHSLGGNTIAGVTSCILNWAEQGLTTKEYLPDKVAIFDAYMESIEDNETYVAWLDDTLGAKGVFGRICEMVDLAHKYGIAVEYVASSTVSNLPSIFSLGKVSPRELYDKLTYIDSNCNYGSYGYNDHVSSYIWYTQAISAECLIDASCDGIPAFGPNMPLSVSLARSGVNYKMDKNPTLDISDDVVYSTNVTAPKIAGFAFSDENRNGINDDRIKNRVEGVTVRLYKGETMVAEAVTDYGGYYEFTEGLEQGVAYTVRVTLPEGTTIGLASDGGFMNNGIAADGTATVALANEKDLKIINIGINK